MRFLAAVPAAILFALGVSADVPPAAEPMKPASEVKSVSKITPVPKVKTVPEVKTAPEAKPAPEAKTTPEVKTVPEVKPALEVMGLSLPRPTLTTPPDTDDRVTVREASLGDSIVLKTNDKLTAYLDYAVTQNKSITLFLNGIDTLVAPEIVDKKKNELQFRLERNADNKNVWAALLRDPFNHPKRRVDASVGLTRGPAETTNATFHFRVIRTKVWWIPAWVSLLVVCLAVFTWLVATRGLLNDQGPTTPFSLGRCQMAWWFFLVVVSYVLIWIISGDQDTITPSLLGLMGISAGTALGAVLIDSTKGSAALSQAATDRLAFLAAQENAAQSVVTTQAAVTAAPADPVAQKNLEDARAAVAIAGAKLLAVNNQLNAVVNVPQTRGPIRDILGDSNGSFGLHRFQIVVWTLVLGIIFLVSVVMELKMPEFSTTLLATMGISAGTYLGFKFPEK
jgi:hypothetical protein